MTNDKPPDPNRQLSLFDYQFESSIRRVTHNEELFFSLVDIVAHFSDTNQASRYWSETKQRLERDGFEPFDEIEQLRLTAKDGKERLTDCGNLETCLRIIQSIPHKNAEPVRRWLAQQGVKAIEAAAQRKRLDDIGKLERAGFGDHPATQRLRDRNHSIVQLKALKAVISKTCDQPRWGEIHNSEYLALFGEVAGSLKTILNTKDIRDGLPTPQLRALTYSESLLEQVIAQQNRLTQQQILDVIEEIVKPIGSHLQEVCNRMGIHHITGQALIDD